MANSVKRQPRNEPDEIIRSFQMRLSGDHPALDDLADRYQRAKRTVYGKASRTGRSFDAFKAEMCAAFGLPARLFNAIRLELDGMVTSAHETATLDIAQLEDRVARLASDRARLAGKLAEPDLSNTKRRRAQRSFHRKRESRDRLLARRARLSARAGEKYPSICFGSRRLFNAQHDRDDKGYGTHAAWLDDWRAARSDQFMVVGSNDEPSGNRTCRARVADDNSVSLDLYLGKQNGHVTFDGLMLPHGHAEWVAAIAAADAEFMVSQVWQNETAEQVAEMDAARVAVLRKERTELRVAQPKRGHGICYRFVKDRYGWRLFVTVTQNRTRLAADFSRGAIGLDVNDQHVSRTRIDPAGNLLESRDLPLMTAGKSSGQRLAIMHDVSHALICEAMQCKLPIVIEKLDFAAKKRRLCEVGCAAAARRLSAFSYSKFAMVLKGHARLHGVCVVEVNPAYTSLIGAAIHGVPHGLSVHAAAAMAIARRGMAVDETIPQQMRLWCPGRAPRAMERPSTLQGKGPAEPLWSGWSELAKAVHAAQAEGKVKRLTGSQRRRTWREDAALRDDAEFLRGW
jgi:IS605 OrfB family transposase